MRKLITILISVLMCFSFISISAEENDNIYVSTETNASFDQYVNDNVGTFIMAQSYSSVLTVHTGIKVYNSDDEQYVYPVSMNGNIVATFVVTKKDDEFYGDFSNNLADIISEIGIETSSLNPLYIYRNNGKLYVACGTQAYDVKEKEYVSVDLSEDSDYLNSSITDLSNTLDYTIQYQIGRSIISYYHWTNYYTHSSEYNCCGPVTMYNIYRNLGYSTYTSYTNYSSHMSTTYYNYYGSIFVGYVTSYEMMRKFLVADGYSVTYQSSSGRMTESQISSTILTNHRYIMAFCNNTSGNGHICGIVGETVNNSSVMYYVFDPFSGIHTTTDSNFSLTAGDGYTYYWTGGYFGDFY